MAEQVTQVLGIVGIKNMGEYNSQTMYEKLNVVTYNGSSYCAKQSSQGILPTNPDYWQLYAEKGDTGDTGIQGPPGYTPVKGIDYFTAEDRAEFSSEISEDVEDEVSEQLGSLVSAAPLAAASVSEMSDTTRVYVNTTNGYWYYYNGSEWVQGGIYQSAVDPTDASKCVDFLENYIYTSITKNKLFSPSTGEIEDYGSWAVINDYIDIDSITDLVVPLWNGAGCIVFYDENKNFISALQGTGRYTTTGQEFTNLNNAPEGTKYIRCCYSYNYQGNEYPPTIVTKLGKLIENINNKIDEKNEQIDSKINNNTNEIRNGILNLEYLNNKYIKLNGEIANLTNWKCSADFLPIEYISRIFVPLWNGASCVAFYDENKDFISGIQGTGTYPGTNQKFTDLSTAPEGTKYIKVSYNNLWHEGTYPPTIVSRLEQVYKYSPSIKWNKKVCAFLGDSITAGAGTTTGNRYWEYLQDMLGINSHGYGVSGARISQLYTQAETMAAQLEDTVDCIFIFAGTNDFFHGLPIGEWYTTSQETVVINKTTGATAQREKRTFIENDTTVKGSLNKILNYLKTNYPTKQIIVMTPLHRAYAEFSNTNIQYDELYANRIGVYFDEYIKTIKEACSIWSVPCIDLYTNSGLFPLTEDGGIYFNNPTTDRLHPNALGHKRLANVICNELNKITCEFEEI